LAPLSLLHVGRADCTDVYGLQQLGILLVDGDLTEGGNFTFTGVVIARGTVKASGTGNSVTGVSMAAVDLSQAVTLAGNTTVQYSSCAVQQALASSSTLMSAKGRAWVNLY
jgi:hypothetical protein